MASYTVVGSRTQRDPRGHSLLNTGGHTTVNRNLMNNGTQVTPEQCQLMNANLPRLFGDTELPDPGPPS